MTDQVCRSMENSPRSLVTAIAFFLVGVVILFLSVLASPWLAIALKLAGVLVMLFGLLRLLLVAFAFVVML